MDPIAVFGIGSTNFRYTVSTPDGEFLTDITVEPTQPDALTAQLNRAIRTLDHAVASPLTAISIACTGLVDPAAGRIQELDTKTGTTVRDLDVRSALEQEFDLPVYIENDCTAAALGEWHFGAGDGSKCLAHVTIGTGIGAGIVDHGHVLRGETGQAAEVGLFPIAPETELESFGVPGAWEAVCSGRGIPAYVSHRLETEDRDTQLRDRDGETAQMLFAAAQDGDPVATEYLEDVLCYNAAGVGTLCNAYNPGVVTLGGGVALNNPDTVLEGIRARLDEYCYVDIPEIKITELGDDIGLYGAVARAADAASQRE